jgi:hypothetical protein
MDSFTRFIYSCSQDKDRQKKPQKVQREGAKQRDKESMDTFDCHGHLQIVLSPYDTLALVKLIHRDDHIPYWNIDVPKDVRDFIHANPNLTPQQVRLNINYKFA